MHTLFALEDIYGLKIENIDGKICIYTDPDRVADNDDLSKSLSAWEEQAAKLYAGEITKALEITGLSGRFGVFLLDVLQDERV